MEVLDKAPAFIEDYEPLDMQEKFWAMRFPRGTFLTTMRTDWRPGYWRRASKDVNDILADWGKWKGDAHINDGRLVEVTLGALLSTPMQKLSTNGVAILDGYPNVARYIEARPGEK